MKRKRFSMRAIHAAEWTKGDACSVIRPFALLPTDKVLLTCRKSGRERKQNLDDQEANLREVVEKAGATVVGVFRWQASGFDPTWLPAAVMRARRLGATVILAETTDRLIRNEYYHSKERPNLQATEEQLVRVARLAGGMTLMTHLDPNATPSQAKTYQISRGQRMKNKKGGRPPKPGYKKRRRWANLVSVRRAKRKGMSIRQIAQEFGIAKSTVCEWLKR